MSAPTELPEVILIETKVFQDSRGWFLESYSARRMNELGITNVFVQDNHSYSRGKGVVRGLHFQDEPMAQAKLVRCTVGSMFDVAVDIRKGSPRYGKWMGYELSAENKRQLFIPKGFAHGFVTLEEECEVQYKVDAPYSPQHERGIRFNDEDIGVEWGVTDAQLSEKDQRAPSLRESRCSFVYKGK